MVEGKDGDAGEAGKYRGSDRMKRGRRQVFAFVCPLWLGVVGLRAFPLGGISRGAPPRYWIMTSLDEKTPNDHFSSGFARGLFCTFLIV